MVESNGLLNRRRGITATAGSNPALSAIFLFLQQFHFTAEELNQGWQELQESDEGLTGFEMQVVAGGMHDRGFSC